MDVLQTPVQSLRPISLWRSLFGYTPVGKTGEMLMGGIIGNTPVAKIVWQQANGKNCWQQTHGKNCLATSPDKNCLASDLGRNWQHDNGKICVRTNLWQKLFGNTPMAICFGSNKNETQNDTTVIKTSVIITLSQNDTTVMKNCQRRIVTKSHRSNLRKIKLWASHCGKMTV